MSDETWVVTLPKLGESVTEGVIGTIFKTRRRRGRVRRPAVRGVDRQGRLGDPEPLRRCGPGGSGASRRNRLGRRPGPADRREGSHGGEPTPVGVARGGGGRRSFTQRSLRAVDGRIGGAVNRGGRFLAVVRRRRGLRDHDAETGRVGHRGHGRQLAQGGRRRCRIRRSAVRRVDRQGRFGDPEPVRRDVAGHPGPRRRDGAGGHRARPHRGGRAPGRIGRQRQRAGRRPRLRAPTSRRPAAARSAAMAQADGCCRRWCAGSSPSTAST